MKQYAILKNNDGAIEAVQLGKSYFAFFLTPVWAGLNKLWVIAAVTALFDLLILGYQGSPDPAVSSELAQTPGGTGIMFMLVLVYHIYFSIKASSLQIARLIKDGYVQKEITLAVNKDAAISAFATKNQ